ncbi:MAG TPA: GGDEF domain-containing protein [Chlorobaculum parvum]|uniref:diguanylate cyclase n=1 Tax=Chlorobaculum parvum TaxID=274539 RepID=A0A7C5HJY7_9CHLB|nr:GGDEF domain-containing protein [Chlorobaculum parvum]
MKQEYETSGRGLLRLPIITGVAALLLTLGGTAWFGAYQTEHIRAISLKQDLRMKLVECRTTVASIEKQLGSQQLSLAERAEIQSRLRIECARFTDVQKNSGIKPESELGLWLMKRKPITGIVNRETLQLIVVDLDEMIAAMTSKIAEENDMVGLSLTYYLVFITILLLFIVLAGGRLLASNYRHSIIPLHQLAQRLLQLNRDLPESLHDTAEAAEDMLTGPNPSAEMRSVTSSVASLCHDIEAKNKKLDEIYIRDEKTGLYNYRHFKEHLIIDVERAKRFGASIALAMIDIDHFKMYNDLHGHIEGDKVLVRIAEIIQQECRATDIPSRFGGEEFALLFPKTDRQTALEIAKRLQSIISAEPFEHESTQPGGQLTVSIGVAALPDDAADWYSLINNADKALYKAKSSGRNKVLAFIREFSMEQPPERG